MQDEGRSETRYGVGVMGSARVNTFRARAGVFQWEPECWNLVLWMGAEGSGASPLSGLFSLFRMHLFCVFLYV